MGRTLSPPTSPESLAGSLTTIAEDKKKLTGIRRTRCSFQETLTAHSVSILDNCRQKLVIRSEIFLTGRQAAEHGSALLSLPIM